MDGAFKDKENEWAKVIAQAWADEDFKKKLFADPTAVLKEHGIEFPEGMKVKLIEDKKGEVSIPFPARPSEVTGGPEALHERIQAQYTLCMSA
jgi:hypothetical protein